MNTKLYEIKQHLSDRFLEWLLDAVRNSPGALQPYSYTHCVLAHAARLAKPRMSFNAFQQRIGVSTSHLLMHEFDSNWLPSVPSRFESYRETLIAFARKELEKRRSDRRWKQLRERWQHVIRDRQDRLLRALGCQVRCLKADQILRGICYPSEVFEDDYPDNDRVQEVLRSLIENDYIRTVKAFAVPTPKLSEPLAYWEPRTGFPTPDFGKVAYQNERRWEGAPRAQTVYVGTSRLGRLFGTKRTGNLPQPLQASHDVAVGELYTHLVRRDWSTVDLWRGEDIAVHVPGEKVPDAHICFGDTPHTALEVAGLGYGKNRLLELHRHCDEHGLVYEVW